MADRQPDSFGVELGHYLSQLDSLRSMVPVLVMFAGVARENFQKKLDEYAEEQGIEIRDSEDGGKHFSVPPSLVREFDKLYRRVEAARASQRLVPPTFVVSLVSQYDAFLGRLIRLLFVHRPDLLAASERKLAYADLRRFESIDAAAEHMVEKEVESVLRDSHTAHFDWLERKLDTTLRNGLKIWPTFVELTQRRNLFVHTDGRVSSQYLEVCGAHGVDVDPDTELGDELTAPSAYFRQACDCLFELATKLTHVMWRKLDPDDREAADSNLNEVCHDLLVDGRNELALNLLDFATGTLKRHSSEQLRLFFVVNRAQALKRLDRSEDKDALIASEDWSAMGNAFKLAKALLEDRHVDAAAIMRQIGPDSDEVPRSAYSQWALFKEFRFTDEFQEAFLEIFGEDFVFTEEELKADGEAAEPSDDGAPSE